VRDAHQQAVSVDQDLGGARAHVLLSS